MAKSIWGNINTCFEIGIEICRLMEAGGKSKGADDHHEVEKMMDGVFLMSNDKEVLIAVKAETAKQHLSDTAITSLYCEEKNGHFVYQGAAATIPLFELSRVDASVRNFIVSEESLRATLCGNYPEYVKSHNLTAPPDAQIKNADAPLYLFLQKQLDQAADETRAQVADLQHAQSHTNEFDRGTFDDVLDLER